MLTEFILSYRVGANADEALGSTASPDLADSNATDSTIDSDSNGTAGASGTAGARPAQRYTDLAAAPEPLRPYLTDLARLGVLDSGSEFQPNEPVTRRAYARWLMAANNRIHSAQPDKQIRTAVGSSQPAFQDVPPSDTDFGAIQGLANAGIIPSPLSGNTTTVAFRPDAPLTREELVLWKMPLDLRRSLPEASIDAVEQTWGFQDTAQIEPRALRAVSADYQNSDLSNIRRAFGYTTLFQPKAAVTRAEAAATLWRFGMQGEGVTAKDAAE
ncbi:MAG: S-layer homology domain-containing protein [Kaiparowitsia implicata GSE-PSE-MK54-09C]|nr:S-layer homology domain-containing protein [Kaiparowitsia implicata GSE-PSE-MK54-09C]